MGRYQWQLFALCGGGWLADNLWLQVSIWNLVVSDVTNYIS